MTAQPLEADVQHYDVVEVPPTGKGALVLAECDDPDIAQDLVDRLNSHPIHTGYSYYLQYTP